MNNSSGIVNKTGLKEGDYIQEKQYKKPMKIIKNETTGELGISVENNDKQYWMPLSALNLKCFEKIEKPKNEDDKIVLEVFSIDKDNYISLVARKGKDYIGYLVDDSLELYLLFGKVNNIEIRNIENSTNKLDYELDYTVEPYMDRVNEINEFVKKNYLKIVKNRVFE